jgi:hypothetical protein
MSKSVWAITMRDMQQDDSEILTFVDTEADAFHAIEAIGYTMGEVEGYMVSFQSLRSIEIFDKYGNLRLMIGYEGVKSQTNEQLTQVTSCRMKTDFGWKK